MNDEQCTLTNFGEKKLKATVYGMTCWLIIGWRRQS
jgi:hypothetical protein